MPEYVVERVIVKRETFRIIGDSPEDVQARLKDFQPVAETTETDIQISLAGEKRPKGRSKGMAARGTRIPDDWQPDVDYAKSKGMHPQDIEREAEKFRNYWHAKPGAGGVKLDWKRTWYTWVMTFCERRGLTPAPHPPSAPSAQMMSDAQWNKALELYWKNERWHRDYGPELGRPGCRVPAHLLPEGLRRQSRPRIQASSSPEPDFFVR